MNSKVEKMFVLEKEFLQLEKFEVFNLFEVFNYKNINFKTNEGIMIIHGVNGTGKTTILRILNYFANCEFLKLSRVNFQNLRFSFKTSKTKQSLVVEIINESPSYLEFEFKYNNESFSFLYEVKKYEKIFKTVTNENFENFLHFIKNPNQISNQADYERIFESNIFPLYRESIFHGKFPQKELIQELEQFRNFRKIVLEIKTHFKCLFIQSQRLDLTNYLTSLKGKDQETRKRRTRDSRQKQLVAKQIRSVIEHKSLLIRAKIRENLIKYTKTSQTQDKDLVKRIINSIASNEKFTYDEVYNELEKLENTQANYSQAGLDTSDVTRKIDLRSSLQKSLAWDDERQIQTLYRILKKEIIADSWKKIVVFESLYKKIALFQLIINEHLINKRLEISHEVGFIIISNYNQKKIDLNWLSSGERNLIILFFELIFETEPYTLIMIDEPEISLHVEWQIRFIKNLLKLRQSEIKELTNIRFILATHSPQIIHNRRDLTVELGE